MKNLSEITINTGKEQAINLACSETGLSDTVVGKIYESQKLDGKTDQQIFDYFTNITKTKETVSAKDFVESMSQILSELSLDDSKKHDTTKKFLSTLNDFDNEKIIDTVSLLDIINEILIINNPKAKEKLIPILELEFTGLESLNESLNFKFQEQKNENSVLLFEGLKDILNKNNKRWGITYHIQNSYNAIMKYISEETEEIQLAAKMNSVSNEYHMSIINDMLSGNVSPLNKHVSSVKQLVPDLQTLVFDMVLLVNVFMNSNDSSLQFVNRQTFNDYNETANLLLKNIFSSFVSSQIISNVSKKNYLETNENTNEEGINSEPFYYGKDEILSQTTQLIDSYLLKYNIWSMSLKSVVDMLNFIKSSSTEFNLKIRPIMRTYITKSYELTSSVEKANLSRKQASSY